MLTGIVAGWGASVALLGISSAEFVKGMRLFFETFDVNYGLVKSASFGAAVTLIGCAAGMGTMGGAQGVGRAATDAAGRAAAGRP
jgi:phospholipid/cholesterol/gamma-HCH transport system permease protein